MHCVHCTNSNTWHILWHATSSNCFYFVLERRCWLAVFLLLFSLNSLKTFFKRHKKNRHNKYNSLVVCFFCKAMNSTQFSIWMKLERKCFLKFGLQEPCKQKYGRKLRFSTRSLKTMTGVVLVLLGINWILTFSNPWVSGLLYITRNSGYYHL